MVEFTIINLKDIKFKIAKKGYSLRGFSQKIGISHSYLSQLLNERKKPSATIASKIAKGLEEDVTSLFLIKVVDELPTESKIV